MERDKGYPLELQAGFLGFRSTSKERAFNQRKLELIKRDPLTNELIRHLETFHPLERPSEGIIRLKEKLEGKWSVEVLFTKERRYWYERTGQAYPGSDYPLIIYQGYFRGEDGELYAKKTQLLKAYRLNSDYQKDPDRCLPSVPILPTDDKLLIEIDLNLVDQGEDAGFLKKEMAWLIDICLKRRKIEGRKPTLIGEPKELAFLYHYRSKTFQNYLRWYDLHIGTDYNKPNGFSFRAIAKGEKVLREHPELYEATMKEVANMTKVVRSVRGERVLKGVIGEPIREEGAVGKGVIAIYKAIHRKPYPSKKTKLKEYNCPAHEGRLCPMECRHLKNWMKDFNKAMMLFKPLYTTDPAVLPKIIGEGRSHSKRKPTADQQSNIDKTLYSA